MLDLVRLAENQWLARAIVTRRDGTTMVLEEIFDFPGVPDVEAVIDIRSEESCLVLRMRGNPERILAERSIEPDRVPLRVVHGAHPARREPAPSPTGPPVPA